FVVATPDGILPILRERNVGARIFAEQSPAGVAIARTGIPRRELALVVPDAVGVVALQDLAHHFGHTLVVVRGVATGDIMFRDFAVAPGPTGRDPLRVARRQRLRRAARIDTREHAQSRRVRNRYHFGKQVAAPQSSARAMARYARPIECDDASAVDA